MTRGDVVVGHFPHAANTEPKQRPVLIVQSDFYNARLRNVLVAAITSNLSRQADPSHLLIDLATAEGSATGLLRTITCLMPEPRSDARCAVGPAAREIDGDSTQAGGCMPVRRPRNLSS